MRFIWLILCFVLATTALGQEGQETLDTNASGSEPHIAETLVVSAPQVTVEEVIEAIARRNERDNYQMRDYEYTTLITQVMRDEPGDDGGNYKIEEYALRNHFSRELGEQVAKLWERSRKYEDGVEVEDEVDEEMSAEFLPRQGDIVGAMPFSVSGGHLYNYTILDRQLVGNNLIYKISFRPKNKFEAMPKGTVWVDYSNWVVRKLEAEMTDVVPYPMFLKSVPVYRMSQERFGDFWFPTEIFMRINLRKIPLVPIPDNVEIRASLRDIVINGEPLKPEDTAPGTGDSDLTEEELAGGFWLSAEANYDSLTTYWNKLGDEWEADLSPEAMPITLSMVKVDSLINVGSSRLQDLREGNLWSFKPKFIKTPGYNRTQGFVARVGLQVAKQGPHKPNLILTAGYALANKRPVFSGEFELPLILSNWNIENHSDDEKYLGAAYEVLSLRLSGRKDSALFAGDGRRHTRSASSFTYGGDPNHYYEERGFDGGLNWRLSKGLVLRAGGGFAEHRAWGQETSWNLLGQSLHPEGNRTADYLNDNFFQAGGALHLGPLTVDGEVIWHDFSDTPVMGGDGTLRELKVSAQLDYMDRFSNQWLISGAHREFDGTAPVQWKSWLGDYGSLRGYEAGVLTGDAGAHVALDARLGIDLFQAAKVPFLRNWGLQPIGFMDWGKTWDKGDNGIGPVDPTEGVRGQRMDVGFGFGKRFDIPGLGEFRNVRVYAAHPVGEGHDGLGWRYLLAFEK